MARLMGDVSKALLEAARRRPGRTREIAQEACVGYAAARVTVTRLQQRGLLVPAVESRGHGRRSSAPMAPLDGCIWTTPDSQAVCMLGANDPASASLDRLLA